MIVQESFTSKRMAASGALLGSPGGVVGGFFCTAAGTLALDVGTDATGENIIDSFAVAVGIFYPLPFSFAVPVYATLGGGATGTFAILPNPAFT